MIGGWWCWWCAGAELATRKRLARAACRGHTVHPPATLAEINDNGNTAAVGAIILVQVSASGHVTSLLVQGVVPSTQCSASMINDAMVKYKCLHLE